jgi:NADH dehydrogenase FAD-containing subunit
MFPKRVPITEYAVERVVPEENMLYTEDNQAYTYDQLIIAAGNTL